jgi:hypothetical protein
MLTSKSYTTLINLFPQIEIDNLIDNQFTSLYLKFDNKLRKIDNMNLRIVQRKQLDNYVLKQYLDIGGTIIDQCWPILINKNE